jgi:hypothetical protein
MKETNPPEAQLHSWEPRRPSARLKRRIFSNPFRRPAILTWSLRLAPAAACLLVTLSVWHQSDSVPGDGLPAPLPSQMLGNPQLVLAPADYHQGHNEVAAITFDWTNRTGSTSSISSFSPGKAN